MLINTNAIVISALKYGEADLIVNLYTLESGLRTYMLRGILKSKKGKFKASQFQLLTQLEIVANHKNKGALEYLKDAKVINTYATLHTNMIKASVVMFIAEVLKSAVREEEANPALYNFLETAFSWMDLHDKIANFHIMFLLKLSGFLGFQPDNLNTEQPFFNLLEGTFEPIKTNDYCIQDENLDILRAFLNVGFNDMEQVKLSSSQRSDFLKMMLLYYELHIDGFRKPKSLTVLNEIFN
ncbi:DNA repair protein RecO [Zunongwangia endophytica]|uniref:DNA repair protein RecO n=1 Tax=Zunongwangia endophytica TaxID=1808945 RepID=A0ABV8H3J9_9FLAO|nr:DNA repair protein RecO [Zunongwangia endophytica]MDN3595799.1 DNA repair protein RecO [Zunongwangia endophytica]